MCKFSKSYEESLHLGVCKLAKYARDQSVTSRLETSRYRDFSQFFESISLGLEKESRYRSRKCLVSKKVSVSVSKIFGLEKKSQYRSGKISV